MSEMTPAERQALNVLRKSTLANMSDSDFAFLETEVAKKGLRNLDGWLASEVRKATTRLLSEKQNNTEKPIAKAQALVQALAVLLADTQTVYHEAHGFHWNVKGQDFAQYHELFAEIYSDLYDSIDPIAENILKMQSDAPYTMTQFVSLRTIGDAVTMTAPQAMATQLLADLEALLRTLNSAFDASSAENQQGIANFVAERIDATQKWIWQLRSSVGMQKASGEVGINHA